MNLLNIYNLQVDKKFDFVHVLNNNEQDENFSPYESIKIESKYYSPDSFIQSFQNSKDLSLLNININSIKANFQGLLDLILFFSEKNFFFDIICVQEIGQIVEKSLFIIPGYHPIIFKQRTKHLRGGIGIFVKANYKYSIVNNLSIFEEMIFESLTLEVEFTKDKKFLISNIYRPPCRNNQNFSVNQQHQYFSNTLLGLLDNINSHNKKCILAGDFNYDILSCYQDPHVANFIENMFASGFLEIIKHPTRVAQNINYSTSSLIDHIWVNEIKESFTSGIITTYFSDHFSTFYIINDKKPPVSSKYIKIRNFSENNINSFRNDLENVDFSRMYEMENVQESFDYFNSIFYSYFNRYFCEVEVKFDRSKHSIQKWMTPEILVARNKKMELYEVLSRNPTAYNRQRFNAFKNHYNRLIRNRKKEYYSELLTSNHGNTKKCWEITKEAAGLSNTKDKSVTDKLLINDNEVTGGIDICNTFNQHFTSIASKINERIEPSDRPPDSYLEESEHIFSIPEITPAQIVEVVLEWQNKRSSDFNGLSPFLLKKIIDSVKNPLCHIFNLSIKTGKVPTQLKIAKITPVFKAGGNMHCVNDYRPISLLCIFSKILEKIIATALKQYLASNNIIDSLQFGFQNLNSTFHPMIHLLDHVAKAINRNEYTIGLFLDIKKAFDCVPKHILLMKLKKIGIHGNLLQWFESYLSERKQFVKVGNAESSKLDITWGVPQGSVLGPILFLIFFNDLPNCTLLKSLLFCDDTTLLASGSNLNQLANFVNDELQKISTWFRSNQLSLHPDKTKFTVFHSNLGSIQWDDIHLYINENNSSASNPNPDLIKPIDYVNNASEIPAIKFLGVYFDPNLNFKYHIQKLNEKLSRALFILRQCKKILTRSALKTLYYSIFHCHLIYGILIYSSSYEINLKSIEIKQKMAIRAVTDSHYIAHTGPLFKTMKILPFELLVQYFRVKFMYEFKLNIAPRSFFNMWKTRGNMSQGNIRLRNQEDYSIPFARLNLVNNLPLCTLPATWNAFFINNSFIVEQATSRFKFYKKMKRKLLDSIVVACERLLCPSCDLNINL